MDYTTLDTSNTLFYAVCALIAIFVIFIVVRIKKKKAFLLLVKNIENRYGKNPLELENAKMNRNVPGYYLNIRNNDANGFYIDDITWNDLDMDNVFIRVNNAGSTVGEQYLYYLLRKPSTDDVELAERNRLIEFFRKNPKHRLDVQVLLSKLGKTENMDITGYFFNEFKGNKHAGLNYKLMVVALLLSPFLMIINVQLGFLAIIALIINNITIYNKKKYEIESHLEAFNYIVSLIIYADKISDLQIEELTQYRKKLKDLLKNLKGIVSRSFLVLYRTEDPFLEYIKTVFLGELIAYESMFSLILKYRSNLNEIFDIVGLIDSLISVASFRDSLQYFSMPELAHADKSDYKSAHANKPELHVKDIYHPLIKNPVPNSISINGPILVTGSNASGKSTFLKTVAINAIFAQTICTCLAKSYKSSYFKIFTSMALKDNTVGGESYYIVEIKSLKRIIDALDPSMPCLCIIDEVLRGTNTVERIAASSQILYFLSRQNCIPIAATHDLELAQILNKHYKNYHFQEHVTDNNITFDYKIYPGKSSTRNAIKLLKIMGYGDSIVEQAEIRANAFIKYGIWEEIVCP